MDVKKELAARARNIENAALDIRDSFLSFGSIFDEFQEEAKKYLNKEETDMKKSDSQTQPPPSSGNSPRH